MDISNIVLYVLVGLVTWVFIGDILYKKKFVINNKFITHILNPEKYSQYIFLITALLFIWITRLPLLQIAGSLNADEAAFIAKAMRVRHGWYNWDALDPLTSGPLNSIALAWPYLFGLEVTFTTARITGTLIVSIICLFIFFSLRRLGGVVTAVFFTLPIFIFYGAINSFEFLHYSSEHVSILLLSIAIYCFIRILDFNNGSNHGLKTYWIVAIVLGLVPFAKMQALPLAALVGGLIFLFALMQSKRSSGYWQRIFVLVIGALIPATFFLLPLIITGNFHHFYNSYILNNLYYVAPSLDFFQFIGMANVSYFYWMTFARFIILTILALSSFAFFLHNTTFSQRWALLTVLLALPVAYFCVITPGHFIPHYLHFILPMSALAAGAVFGILIQSITLQSRIIMIFNVIIFMVIIFSVIPGAKKEISQHYSHNASERFFDGLTFHSPNVLQYLQPNDRDFLLVWGWMSEYHAFTGITPATREPFSELQIRPTLQTPYYHERLMSDLELSKPDFIVDAVTPHSFRFDDPNTQSLFSPRIRWFGCA